MLYTITPRKTLLLDDKPTIHWNGVPGATSYLVTVMKGKEVHWQQQVSATEVVYPGDSPLELGVIYSLLIESDNGFSSGNDLDATGLGFRLLDKELTQRLLTAVEAINQQQLEDEAKAIELADLYMEYGLFAEAMEKLKQLVNTENQTARAYYTLGEIYEHIGLYMLAEEMYEQAINILHTGGDLEK